MGVGANLLEGKLHGGGKIGLGFVGIYGEAEKTGGKVVP